VSQWAWDLDGVLDKRPNLSKMDMRLGTLMVRSLFRVGSLMAIAEEFIRSTQRGNTATSETTSPAKYQERQHQFKKNSRYNTSMQRKDGKK
jgi:hypothetical protein